MGFRSTFTTSDYYLTWPEWFCEKYKGMIWFAPDFRGPLHPINEGKTYGSWSELHTDIQRVLQELDRKDITFALLYLHECDGVTRCDISTTAIRWGEPDSWYEVDGITHNYCYTCSPIRESYE